MKIKKKINHNNKNNHNLLRKQKKINSFNIKAKKKKVKRKHTIVTNKMVRDCYKGGGSGNLVFYFSSIVLFLYIHTIYYITINKNDIKD